MNPMPSKAHKIEAALGAIAEQLAVLHDLLLPPPTGVWSYTFGGNRITGRSPMPVSIIDSATGWGVAVSDLRDEAGEPANPAASVALSVDDDTLVSLTDNGDGTGTFGSAIADPGASGFTLPASTGIHATVTNPDGSSFTLDDVITVVAGDAVTGSFAFTPPAAEAPQP